MSYLVGVDIGGTSVKLGLIQFGNEFKVVKQSSIATQPQDAAEVFVKRIAVAARQVADGQEVFGIGVGCPGLIDPWNGMVRTSPNLKNMPGYPLKQKLAEFSGWPVEIQNDANAAVLGEWLFAPSSRNVKNMILLTIGTGIGGGVICDGHLVVGAANAATELGHVKVEYQNGAPCGCGKRGCVEAYAGVAGIRRIANGLIDKSSGTTLVGSDTLSTKEIALAAARGDAVARETFQIVGKYLGRAIGTFIDTFNPEKVILGGGASAAVDLLMPGINTGLDESSSFRFTRDMCRIERSAFPDDINVIGAAATYLNSHR